MTQEVFRTEVPLGPNGLWGSRNLSTMPLTGLIQANNVDYYGGVLSKEGGALQYTTGSPFGGNVPDVVIGGYDWWPDATHQQPVGLLAAGRYYRDAGNGLFATSLVVGLTTANVSPVFVEGGKEVAANNRKIFMFTGKNTVKVVSGVDALAATALATPPADWAGANQPSFGFIYQNRLWGGGNPNDPHRVYYSVQGSHEDFTSAGSGSISIYAGVGEKLIAGFEFKGYIFLFKYPRGIFVINASAADITTWTVQTQSKAIGLCGSNAWTYIDDDVVFMDTSGQIQILSRIDQFTYSARSLSDQQQMRDFITTNVDQSRLWDARAVYYAFKREVHFAVTAPGGVGYNNRRLVIDLNSLPDQVSLVSSILHPKFRFSDRDACESIWMQKDSALIERPFIGDNTGKVWQLDYSSFTKSGGYASQFQTAYLDMAHLDPKFATMNKNGRFLELNFEQTGFVLLVDVYWDEKFSETLQFKMGATTGGFTYTFPFMFKQAGKLGTKRKRVIGSGRQISFVMHNDNANEYYRLSRAYFGFTEGSEAGV